MPTSPDTLDFLLDQLTGLGVSTRRMFGEYCVYLDGKPVAFVCDDQLFVKPTEAGRAVIPNVEEGFPYPGARAYLMLTADQWEDSEWLRSVLRATANALPPPKPKARRKS